MRAEARVEKYHEKSQAIKRPNGSPPRFCPAIRNPRLYQIPAFPTPISPTPPPTPGEKSRVPPPGLVLRLWRRWWKHGDSTSGEGADRSHREGEEDLPAVARCGSPLQVGDPTPSRRRLGSRQGWACIDSFRGSLIRCSS